VTNDSPRTRSLLSPSRRRLLQVAPTLGVATVAGCGGERNRPPSPTPPAARRSTVDHDLFVVWNPVGETFVGYGDETPVADGERRSDDEPSYVSELLATPGDADRTSFDRGVATATLAAGAAGRGLRAFDPVRSAVARGEYASHGRPRSLGGRSSRRSTTATSRWTRSRGRSRRTPGESGGSDGRRGLAAGGSCVRAPPRTTTHRDGVRPVVDGWPTGRGEQPLIGVPP
jgi:hypothetical protein